MAQWAKGLTAKPDYLDLIPGTHTVVMMPFSENVSHILRNRSFLLDLTARAHNTPRGHGRTKAAVALCAQTVCLTCH